MLNQHIKGTNHNVIFLLHGTGGDNTSMMQIGKMIDPNATLIAIQGDIVEEGMNRYFKRYPDGSFNLKSLSQETFKLQDRIVTLIKQYGLEDHIKTVLGYSNGANIAINLFKEFETDFDYAILYHPSPVRLDVELKPQPKLNTLLTYGHGDPFMQEENFEILKNQFSNHEVLVHNYGHTLVEEELAKTREFIKV